MYAEETHFRKLFLKQFEIVLEHSTLVTFDPVTPKSIGFLPYPGWMCGPGIRKVGHVVLQLVIGTVLAHLTTLTFDPVTQTLRGFICYPGWMCGPCLRKVDQGILHLLIENGFGTFDHGDLWSSDPKIKRVHLLPRMDVRTMFEEGRSSYWSEMFLADLIPWPLTQWPQIQ